MDIYLYIYLPDPRGAGLHLAFQFSYVRSDTQSVGRSLRSNFGPYTFIKGQRDKGTTQELGNTGTQDTVTQEHRNTGTQEHRNTGTQEHRNTGTSEPGNLGTWELRNFGTLELWNFGT